MNYTSKKNPPNSKAMSAFTVDMEDWYQGIELPFESWKDYPSRLEIGLRAILELLEKNDVHATFFTLGWVAEKHPELVKEVAHCGHELGSHGYSHEKAYNLSSQDFRKEIRNTRQILEDLSGRPVVCHRSPFFSITSKNLWALEILSDEGFSIDCSVSPIKTWRYGISSCPDEIFIISDAGIIEFPVSTFRIANRRWALGGAYFRILPYFFTKRAFRRRIGDKRCTMFYVHPWEYDPGHPVAPMELKAKITHYTRLKKSYGFTKRLFKDFKFDTVTRVVDHYAASHQIRQITTDLLKD